MMLFWLVRNGQEIEMAKDRLLSATTITITSTVTVTVTVAIGEECLAGPTDPTSSSSSAATADPAAAAAAIAGAPDPAATASAMILRRLPLLNMLPGALPCWTMEAVETESRPLATWSSIWPMPKGLKCWA
ncbi:uncharacterized protein TrAtP1_009041 [Trichoderma atroviride]|nr:hypothetical protein TrAtP1_009041 [Trichoderma atroviride]